MGKKHEDNLETILVKYPLKIPGKQIDSGNNAPPRFVLLSREIPVAGGSSNHLFVDQNGIATFVETNLMLNPESGCEALGRIIEYAANAFESCGGGKAKQRAIEFWNTRGKNLDDVIIEEFGTEDFDNAAFWTTVEKNLRNGAIRLIIATDELRPEVRKMIEYLNKEMRNAEILALELKCYGENSQDLPPAAGLTGQTQSAIDKKNPAKTKWTQDKLKTAYADYENKLLGIQLQKILDWAAAKGVFMKAAAFNPTFGLQGKNGYRIFSFFADGSLYCFFNKKHYPGAFSERNLLVQQLKAVQLLEYSFDPADVFSGQILTKKLQEISDDELEQLLNILLKYCF